MEPVSSALTGKSLTSGAPGRPKKGFIESVSCLFLEDFDSCGFLHYNPALLVHLVWDPAIQVACCVVYTSDL